MASRKKADNVKVVIRCRPLNSAEEAKNCKRCLEINGRTGEIVIHNPKGDRDGPKSYKFDQVYDWNSQQRDIYDRAAQPIVSAVCEGFNGSFTDWADHPVYDQK
eukprot:m.223904 g.223904  ORF g.223904 m.223904 type:complete len:104 (-) comp18762_c3_seq2:116-427(-)